MTRESSSRSVVVDAELLRGMSWDALIYTLTRPLAIIAYTALVAAFIMNAIVLGIVSGIDDERSSTLTLTLLGIAALIAASIIFTRVSVKRAISTAMPTGAAVRVEVGPSSVKLMSKRGVSDMAYSTFRSVRVGKNAAILQLRGTSVVTTIPRALLSDADIAALKAKI
ncbi:MAG: YcxB family protein [Microbacterium sp.]